ncbi:BTB/POZ and TAZ domain-containing protein 2-like [Oryza brachyantha]|uniref:BTB/POZ and TAZ domain-containing protein 2-like n=1 Tax=Oryza brachyantha TaxID=4533 RepID=UPI001ADBD12F|nr:BTB/POZ and TAZ domain-containing protein 2-like [Oryza brachyantha]
MTRCVDLDALRPAMAADVQVVTSDGKSIAAHSFVLATASPVLERMIDRARRGWNSECTIRVLGVSSDAVYAFLHFLYASRVTPEDEEVVTVHGPQLLALSHAYRVGWLKRAAEASMTARLTPEHAVDMLKLARLCDAPRLYLRCARLAAKDFAAVERSDGWRFARRHDAALELEILQLLEDADQRRERWARERASREAYRQLGEAMDSLDHIFSDDGGCTCADVDADTAAPSPCRGLRLLMRHYATCGARNAAPGGWCTRCRRMLQLFRLHASVCDRTAPDDGDHPCRVPLCSHFKAKMRAEKADRTWRLLVKKVTRARAMSRLAAARTVPELVAVSWARYSSGGAARLR